MPTETPTECLQNAYGLAPKFERPCWPRMPRLHQEPHGEVRVEVCTSGAGAAHRCEMRRHNVSKIR